MGAVVYKNHANRNTTNRGIATRSSAKRIGLHLAGRKEHDTLHELETDLGSIATHVFPRGLLQKKSTICLCRGCSR